MGRKYTFEAAKKFIEDAFDKPSLAKLYDEPFISYSGNPIGAEMTYQEIYAKFIFEKLFCAELPRIEKSGIRTYCEKPREDNAKTDNEELVQRQFYYVKRKLEGYGDPVWFEMQTGETGQGKGVDLVYFDLNNSTLHLFELKYKNKGETLLRAILEIQTYYQRINWNEAIRDLKKTEKGEILTLPIKSIKKHVLLDEESISEFEKCYGIVSGGYVEKLMSLLDINIVTYKR